MNRFRVMNPFRAMNIFRTVNLFRMTKPFRYSQLDENGDAEADRDDMKRSRNVSSSEAPLKNFVMSTRYTHRRNASVEDDIRRTVKELEYNLIIQNMRDSGLM